MQYVIVCTTFPEARFPPAVVLDWYRLRWQVERVCKRFQSVAQLGHLPQRGSGSATTWRYGKLFMALLAERRIAHAGAVSPWGDELRAVRARSEPLA